MKQVEIVELVDVAVRHDEGQLVDEIGVVVVVLVE
jgi:hypothetical protein